MIKTLINFILLLLLTSSVSAVTLNLKNAELLTFIETVSQATGKNFIIDPQVQGKVNVISSTEIDNEELYHLFLSGLRVHGYIQLKGMISRKFFRSLILKKTARLYLAPLTMSS